MTTLLKITTSKVTAGRLMKSVNNIWWKRHNGNKFRKPSNKGLPVSIQSPETFRSNGKWQPKYFT